MRQLTSLDAQFLALEDGRNHGHVSAVGVYDPSTAPGGRLDLGVVGDRELAPDVWELIDDVHSEFAELRRLVPKPAPGPINKKEVSR